MGRSAGGRPSELTPQSIPFAVSALPRCVGRSVGALRASAEIVGHGASLLCTLLLCRLWPPGRVAPVRSVARAAGGCSPDRDGGAEAGRLAFVRRRGTLPT